MRALLAGLVVAVFCAAMPARAENVGIDVAVDVADLDPQVTNVAVTCMVCTVDCEAAQGKQVLGTGSASHIVPGPHAYTGTIAVTVPASSSKGTDYLCRLMVSDGQASYVAGTGPDWATSADGQPLTNMLKGKLPGASAPVATKCKTGAVLVNGKCTSTSNNAAATKPTKTCPDGNPMPANGNCGFIGPAIDLGGIFKALTPCPGGQERQADGSCQTKTTTANQVPPALAPCPDGQARLKTGQCPVAKSTFKFLRPFTLAPPANNNGLR
jgi:hypothetical protein